MAHQSLRHFYEDRDELVSCQTVASGVNLQSPVDPVEALLLRVDDSALFGILGQGVGPGRVVGY